MTATNLLLKIISYLKPYRLKLVIAFLALISVVSSLLLLGHAIRDFIDHGFNPQSSHSSINYILLLICVFGTGSFVRSYIINTTAELTANQIKFEAFTNLKNLSAEQLDKLTFSDLASRINSDSEVIARVIIDITSFFIRNILMCLGGIILMFITYTSLSIIAFSVIALISLLASILGRRVRNFAKQAELSKSRISSLVMESLINYKVTSAFGYQQRLENYYLKLNDNTLKKTLQRLKARSVFFASAITTILLTISGIIWYGSQQVAEGIISPGILGAFIFYAIMTATSFGGLIEMISELQKNLANCERIFDLIDLAKTSAIAQNSSELPLVSFPLKGEIKFQNLNYRYNSNNSAIFTDLNLRLPLGAFTAIKGPSGTGKSTLLQLLMGLYEWQSGEIIINSYIFNKLAPRCWNNKLAYVPQDQVFFSGTILDNLTFFADNYSLEKVQQILEELELSSYVRSLPEGLNSDISNMGSNISGGQKQRLAIARALLTSPEILILDEATSQIDVTTEQTVLKVIKNHMKNKTIISAAHRPSAIEIADHIIDLTKI